MRVFRFLLKRWRQLLWPGEEPSDRINVRKWAEQIESLDHMPGKPH